MSSFINFSDAFATLFQNFSWWSPTLVFLVFDAMMPFRHSFTFMRLRVDGCSLRRCLESLLMYALSPLMVNDDFFFI